MSVTLEDLEIRYKNIRKEYPKVKQCSIYGCSNPRDATRLLGEDTSCAYHRLLFDYWVCEIIDDPDKYYHYLDNQRARRTAFTKWRNKIGNEACDKIVLSLVQEAINWEC